MTPQELAELPVGTRVRFFIDWNENLETRLYDYGVIGLSGTVTHVDWADGPTSVIDTKGPAWAPFIQDMEKV